MPPPTRAQNLQTALDNVTARIAEMTLKPRPNYSIDGQSYSWQSLFDSLLKSQETLRQELQNVDGPFECVSYPLGS